MSGVRVTKELLIKKRADRAFLKACTQLIGSSNVFSIVKPRSLVESRSLWRRRCLIASRDELEQNR